MAGNQNTETKEPTLPSDEEEVVESSLQSVELSDSSDPKRLDFENRNDGTKVAVTFECFIGYGRVGAQSFADNQGLKMSLIKVILVHPISRYRTSNYSGKQGSEWTIETQVTS